MRNPRVGRIDERGRTLLTIEQAASFLGVSKRTVHRLLKRGVLDAQPVSIKEARRLVTLDSLEAYKMHKGLSVVELAKRVLELERKVAWLMAQGKNSRADEGTYEDLMSELRKHHPDMYP